MDEVLKKLLESELLSEESKTEISKQWAESVTAYKSQIREEVSNEVRLELSEQWLTEREELVSKIDMFVAENLAAEISDLKSDIERFRDLEAEMAVKLVEEKHRLAAEVGAELDQLVDKIDQFFEMRLAAELEDLREDLQIVKQNEFGRRMFEAFASEFSTSFVDEAAVQSKLNVTESKVIDLERRLADREDELAGMIRESKMQQVLQPLTGKKREQMAMLLKGVDTARLDESYKFFIGRILREEADPTPAKPLTEAAKPAQTKVITGEPASGSPAPGSQVNEDLVRWKQLAGI